jgi:hypothetical protein
MFDRSEQLASSLEKNWLLQVSLGTLALLYSVNSDLADALSQRLNIDDRIVQFAVPFVSVFLFVKGGYCLGEYLRVRKNLIELTAGKAEDLKLDSPTQANLSVAYPISALIHEQDFADAVRVAIWSKNRFQPGANFITRVAYNSIFLVFMIGEGLSVGTGEYLSSKLVDGPVFPYVVVGASQAIVVFWTLQFVTIMHPYFGGYKNLYVAAPVVTTMIAAWAMVAIDPLEDPPAPPPAAVRALSAQSPLSTRSAMPGTPETGPLLATSPPTHEDLALLRRLDPHHFYLTPGRY